MIIPHSDLEMRAEEGGSLREPPEAFPTGKPSEEEATRVAASCSNPRASSGAS
jgi:hypothetical protein